MSVVFALLAIALLLALLLVLAREVTLPRNVRWRPASVEGVAGHVADGLVLQHDDGSAVWATCGYGIYRSHDDGDFERVATVRARAGEPWGGYLRSLRRAFGYQELVEVLPLREQLLLAFAGGDVHRIDLAAGTRERTLRLRYFGRGKGRGLMAFGITVDAAGSIYFGEYVTEPGQRPVAIWRSDDEGRSWTRAFEFPAGMVRHVHAVQHDPVGGGIWVGTGDRDEHCFVGVSHDRGTTFRWVAQGTQRDRTCSFAFFDDAVLWATDADLSDNFVMRWNRGDGAVTTAASLPDTTYYTRRVDDGRAVLGLTDGLAEAWIVASDGRAQRWLGWSAKDMPPRRGPVGGVRLARGEGGSRVLLNPLRTREHEAAIYRFDLAALPGMGD